MSEKIKTKKWNAIYLRCINAISEYQRTGTVYVNLVSTRKDYVFPVPFKESADAYIGYREKIGIVAKSIQVQNFIFLDSFLFWKMKELNPWIALQFRWLLSSWNRFPLPLKRPQSTRS